MTSPPLTMFKAIRGAAPSFGIVTQWVYDTLPVPAATVGFSINLPAFSNSTSFVSAFKAYQSFVLSAPNEMAMSFSFGASSSSALGVNLVGNYFGTQDSFNSLVQPLVAQISGATVTAQLYTNWTAVLVANAQGQPLQTDTPDTVCRTLDCTTISEVSLSLTISLPKYVTVFSNDSLLTLSAVFDCHCRSRR